MLKLWDADTGREMRSMGGHTGTITSVFLLPKKGMSSCGEWDCLSVCVRLPVYPFICVSICPSVCVSVCLSVYHAILHLVVLIDVPSSFRTDQYSVLTGSKDCSMKIWSLSSGKLSTYETLFS